MIHLDTSAIIECITGERRLLPDLLRLSEGGARMGICTVALYEWLRGPRLAMELTVQEAFLPSESALPFEAEDARISADIYRALPRARSREIDIAIAACAIRHNAELWTLNRADFVVIPQLRLLKL